LILNPGFSRQDRQERQGSECSSAYEWSIEHRLARRPLQYKIVNPFVFLAFFASWREICKKLRAGRL